MLVSAHLYSALSSTVNFARRNIFMRFYYYYQFFFLSAVSHCLLSCLQSGTVWNTRTYQKYLKVFTANNKFYVRSNAGCEYKGDAIKFANGMEFARLHSTHSGKAQKHFCIHLTQQRQNHLIVQRALSAHFSVCAMCVRERARAHALYSVQAQEHTKLKQRLPKNVY